MRILRIFIAPVCVAALSAGHRAAAVDEFVGIDVFPQVRTLVYAPGEFPTATVFVGEPVEFVVSVHNNTRQPITVDGQNLFDQVTIAVERKGQPIQDQLRIRRLSSSATELRTLAPGRRVDSTFSLMAPVPGLQVGVYLARVALPSTAVGRTGRRFNDSLSRETAFEVRAHATELENWDYLLHLVW